MRTRVSRDSHSLIHRYSAPNLSPKTRSLIDNRDEKSLTRRYNAPNLSPKRSLIENIKDKLPAELIQRIGTRVLANRLGEMFQSPATKSIRTTLSDSQPRQPGQLSTFFRNINNNLRFADYFKLSFPQELIELIHKHSVLIPPTLENGKLTLNEAFRKNEPFIVNRLLKQGLDPSINYQDQFGLSAFHTAILTKHTPEAIELVKKGVDPFIADKNGHTALDMIAQLGETDKLTAILHVTREEFKSRNQSKIQELQTIAKEQETQITHYQEIYQPGELQAKLPRIIDPAQTKELAALIASGAADIHAKDVYGFTPLHWTVIVDGFLCRLLVAGGANMHATTVEGLTPLHMAVDAGRFDTTLALLAAGANIHAKDVYDSTPLHMAAEAGRFDITLALLKAGANSKATDKNNKTPVALARLHGHTKIAQAIEEYQRLYT
jgi:ankyrin repeat protein